MKFSWKRTGKGEAERNGAVWVAPATAEQLTEGLFQFLVDMAADRPRVARPLLPAPATFEALCRNPPAELTEALRHFLATSLARIGPEIFPGGRLELGSETWGWVLAVCNVLAPTLVNEMEEDAEDAPTDPATPLLRSLTAALAPARTPAEVLACHALLEAPAVLFARLPEARAAATRALLRRSPLSAAIHLDVDTPPALLTLLKEMLPGADPQTLHDGEAPLELDDWLDTLRPLLDLSSVARYLRQRWLALPETRTACRNLGLVLEALRRRGERDLVLEFYEAYDYFTAREHPTGRPWPVLSTIAALLAEAGTSEASYRIHQWGATYLLKFQPLLEITRVGGEVPRDFGFLSRELVVALRQLVHQAPGGVAVEFRDE